MITKTALEGFLKNISKKSKQRSTATLQNNISSTFIFI